MQAEAAVQCHWLAKSNGRRTGLITLGNNVADHSGTAIGLELYQGPAFRVATKLPLVTAVLSRPHGRGRLTLRSIIALFIRHQTICNHKALLDNPLHGRAGDLDARLTCVRGLCR